MCLVTTSVVAGMLTPHPRVRTLIAGVARGMTMTALTPIFLADRATPWAWLPALMGRKERKKANGNTVVNKEPVQYQRSLE